jgi:hypothetical protein
MSTKKKPKKLRTPNVPMAASGPVVMEARGGGAEHAAATARTEAARAQFDYTHVKKDLARIGVLAGGCIALLVALSFIIR